MCPSFRQVARDISQVAGSETLADAHDARRSGVCRARCASKAPADAHDARGLVAAKCVAKRRLMRMMLGARGFVWAGCGSKVAADARDARPRAFVGG